MIQKRFLDAWRYAEAPWPTYAMVEQDLIISRALVDLYNHPKIKGNLVFRGGTALNKLFLKPAARYSEDIDMVQIVPEPIGESLTAIRSVLDEWLGEPKRKLTERSVKLIYYYQTNDNLPAKLKIEINTTEHYHLFDYLELPFEVNSEWFAGKTQIKTYQLDELMGSKLRALYQRRKGRDLFDLWFLLSKQMLDIDKVIKVFKAHGEYTSQIITKETFEKNMIEKSKNDVFRNEITNLIAEDANWDFDKAYQTIYTNIIANL
ncbi:MAG: nucleotidyl transferase AbiEii/AbiGii toxin family protein [Gammaproteobacteria bacterium]|nr:nucleotidyl transferase AbiEii/AbiGii toxin family protein [Gammaproteobacteria bacterium]